MQIYKPNYMDICIQYRQNQINMPLIEGKVKKGYWDFNKVQDVS